MAQDVQLSIWEHLNELRGRLLKAAIAMGVGLAIGMVFAERLIQLLEAPIKNASNPDLPVLQALQPTENFQVYFKVAFIMAVVIAMPMIIYQLVRYVLPGLEPNEKRYLYWMVPGASLSFTFGVCFAAFVMLPAAVNFLQGFLQTIASNNWTISYYIGFVTNVMFWVGVVFEMPLIMFFLAKLGIITPKKLAGFRKYAIVVNAVIAAMITPTPDPVNMTIVMIPLVLLYEVGVILAKIAVRGRKTEERKA